MDICKLKCFRMVYNIFLFTLFLCVTTEKIYSQTNPLVRSEGTISCMGAEWSGSQNIMIPVYEGDHSIIVTQEVYELRGSTPHLVIYLELTTELGIMTIAPKHPLEYYLLESGKRVITTFDFEMPQGVKEGSLKFSIGFTDTTIYPPLFFTAYFTARVF